MPGTVEIINGAHEPPLPFMVVELALGLLAYP
jgi:hypothetical protein